ncbi:PTS sugar transporter subunit IIC [Vibrio parahaemolyticus]|nr:PTS sugar transporter subunit IIC [Vibrio parahaemolyticus]
MSLLTKMIGALESSIVPIAGKIGSNKYIMSIRDGFISAMPFLIVGSFLLVLAYPPFAADTTFSFGQSWLAFAQEYKNNILLPFSMTMGVMSMFVVIGISYSLAGHLNIDKLTALLLSLAAFFLISAPAIDGAISTQYLGSKGVFTAIFVSIYCVKLIHFCKEKNLVIKLPEQVPARIAESFQLLIPVMIAIATLYPLSIYVQHATGDLIPALVMHVVSPLVGAVSTLPGILICVALANTLWFFGIHVSVVTGVINVVLIANVTENAEKVAAGLAMPHVLTEPFWNWFIVFGGAGATIGLTLMMVRSKSSHLRTIGKLGLVPSLFNINEPVLFGAPIVMNPMLFVPLLLAPMVSCTFGYFMISTDIIPNFFMIAPWTVPAPIGAAWSSGWNITPALAVVAMVAVTALIWYPFFKAYEKQLLEEEQAQETNKLNSANA